MVYEVESDIMGRLIINTMAGLCDQRIPHLQRCLGELATLEKCCNVVMHVIHEHNHRDPLTFWVR